MKGMVMKRIFIVFLFIAGIVSNVFAGDRFVRDNTKEVVIDTKTNLMWQDNEDTKTVTKTWQGAIDYCENLTLGGYNDWRLPNINELWGITDRSRYDRAIDPVFQNVVGGVYWSSTTCASATSLLAWEVSFIEGRNYLNRKSYNFNVRCVRDNK